MKWTITVDRLGQPCDAMRHDARLVPVVPCDEAAKARARDALDAFDGRTWAGASRSEVVDAVLRAAGVTDG